MYMGYASAPRNVVLLSEHKKRRDVSILVCRSVGEGCCREADAAICDVEHVVEPLEEGHAVDEVETLAAEAADVVHDEED